MPKREKVGSLQKRQKRYYNGEQRKSGKEPKPWVFIKVFFRRKGDKIDSREKEQEKNPDTSY